MKVWVVMDEEDYYGPDFIGVASSLAAARTLIVDYLGAPFLGTPLSPKKREIAKTAQWKTRSVQMPYEESGAFDLTGTSCFVSQVEVADAH